MIYTTFFLFFSFLFTTHRPSTRTRTQSTRSFNPQIHVFGIPHRVRGSVGYLPLHPPNSHVIACKALYPFPINSGTRAELSGFQCVVVDLPTRHANRHHFMACWA
ncbi:hypothetical protein H4582DRAFT_283489 [Lactarius indigo]|nr:hypothetical protein H4582DRAFT_283489 [Lactarius indigo]